MPAASPAAAQAVNPTIDTQPDPSTPAAKARARAHNPTIRTKEN